MLAGDNASFVVWVWALTAGTSAVTVGASVHAASYLSNPSFTICPSASGSSCTIASLPLGDAYELLASIPVSSSAPLYTDIELTARVSASGASSYSADATDIVVAPNTPGLSNSSGDSVVPLQSLPPLPGTGVSAENPADLFPTVAPSSSSGSTGSSPARSRSVVPAADVASVVPIDTQLLGAQILGLAALVGAVTIAIVRLSLRKLQPVSPGLALPAITSADPAIASADPATTSADPVDPADPTPTA